MNNSHAFTLNTATLHALPSGALWWPGRRLLCVSDLHLGKSERIARRSGALLPPYDSTETLERLDADITATDPATVVCLGDSFDDLSAAQNLESELDLWLTRLIAGRDWIWIEGNHDPGPIALSGRHMAELVVGPLQFRHIALAGALPSEVSGEISGHYHPKHSVSTRGQSVTRPCFLSDGNRMILPAYGAYTGGLRTNSPEFAGLMHRPARAILTGKKAIVVPARMPVHRNAT